MKTAAAQFPTYGIAVTGHSLGGAIAPFAAAQLRNSGFNVALYTFGSPRISGPKLSSYISAQAGGNYRLTHWNDPVPKVPLLTMGYVHISPEYYISRKNGETIVENDINIFEGAINLFKGNAAWFRTDVEAHRWYFGSMYGSGFTCVEGKVRRGVDVVVEF